MPWCIVYDVNGFYALLGVRTDATKVEIRERVSELQRTEDVDQVAVQTAAKVLLNTVERAKYDSIPLGSVYATPELIAKWEKIRLRQERARAAIKKAKSPRQFFYDESAEPLDPVPSTGAGSSAPRQAVPSPQSEVEVWPWSYYVTHAYDQGPGHLLAWQSLLTRHIGGEGVITKIAMGLDPTLTEPVVKRVGYRTVVFFPPHHLPSNSAVTSLVTVLTQEGRS